MALAGRIRLFVDAHCFDKEHQGTRAFIKRLYISLSALNPNIDFYFGARNIAALQTELAEVKNAYFVAYRFNSSLMRLLYDIPLIVKRHRIDIGHYQYLLPFIVNSKTVVTTHDILFADFKIFFPGFYRFTRGILFKYSIKSASVKTTVSEYSRNRIHARFNIPKEKIHILSNGLGKAYFENYDPTVSKKYIAERFGINQYILNVSRFEPRKNHFLLLKTYLDLKLYEKQISLVMLGHKSLPTYAFNALLNNLSPEIRKFIFVSSETSDDDLFHFYRGTMLFIYPSFAEGFGLPPLEAAALKIPVICSGATAMSEFDFLRDDQFDPQDSEKLKKLILQKLSQKDHQRLDRIAGEIRKKYFVDSPAQTYFAALKKLFPNC